MEMKLKKLCFDLSVCRIASISDFNAKTDFYFFSRTDEELSLVCPTESVPQNAEKRSDGWRGFRIDGVLDFSMVGVLSRLSGILAENGIGIFAVSTFNTDYILVKSPDYERALDILEKSGYEVSD